MTMHHSFPTWRYHRTLAPEGRVFQSQDEIDMAGEGWIGNPAHFERPHLPQFYASSHGKSGQPPTKAVMAVATTLPAEPLPDSTLAIAELTAPIPTVRKPAAKKPKIEVVTQPDVTGVPLTQTVVFSPVLQFPKVELPKVELPLYTVPKTS